MTQVDDTSLITVGLTAAEVLERRRAFGENVLAPPGRDPWWRLYLAKFDDPVIRILLIAAALSVVVGAVDGHYAEGIGIVLAVLLATGLAYWNEARADRQFDLLRSTSDDMPVTVRRDGGYVSVPRRDLVVGDVVQLNTGDEIPADGDLAVTASLLVDESRLTGEAVPVPKATDEPTTGEDAYPANRVLRGTAVADGHGTMVVTAVGEKTEIGATARAAAEDPGGDTPLSRQLAKLSKVIGVIGLGVASATFWLVLLRDVAKGAITFATGELLVAATGGLAVLVALARVWAPIVFDGIDLVVGDVRRPTWLETEGVRPWLSALGVGLAIFAAGIGAGVATGIVPKDPSLWLSHAVAGDLLQCFLVAVTIIVVAVPEGLAMSVTLSLAYSMRRMAAANTLVRRLPACETVGAATVICSDKTGTLTKNEMRVVASSFPPGPLPPAMAEAVAANSTAQLDRRVDPPAPLGNPTEAALLRWLHDHGVDYANVRAAFSSERVWPFSTERKLMAVAGRSAVSGKPVLAVKGAPEVILARCSHIGDTHLSSERAADVLAEIATYQARGMRVLGLAAKTGPVGSDLDANLSGLTWQGYVALADPVRDDVPDAIAACRSAGIAVKVVTGDNHATASEIARQVGLAADAPGAVLTGPEFAAIPDAEAAAAAERLTVMARARPGDKLRLVKFLKQSGHVVAVTGDGVNDGPALNYADVGLSMGKTGTAVAKEASDIVLLDDSFKSVVSAVMWGRSLYENIQRFLLFQLTINVAALGLAVFGPLVGIRLPLTVMQMLWVNLIMDTFAALALATGPANPLVLTRPPRKATAFIVTSGMAFGILATGALFLGGIVALMSGLEVNGIPVVDGEPSRGGTIVFTAFVMLQFWNVFNARAAGSGRHVFAGLAENPWFLLVAAVIPLGQFLIVQFGGTVFRTVPLSTRDWVLIVVGTLPVLAFGELVRFVLARRRVTASGAA